MKRASTETLLVSELQRLLQNEVKSSLQDFFQGTLTEASGQSSPTGNNSMNSLNIVINNNANTAVSVNETTGMLNQRQLEINIDQMVANALVDGRQTSGVLRSLFGIAPNLIGR